jgi:glucose-6-phosphate dehydrogenase assembly protein OpcA
VNRDPAGRRNGRAEGRDGKARLRSVLDLGAEARSIGEIESLLAQLRHGASVSSAQEGSVPPARTAALNVVVYATREVHAERAARAIAELGARHPSRAIILLHQTEGPEAVRLFCHQELGRGRQVCYEQIVVRAATTSAHRLRSAIIPLLSSDLPVFLWWTGVPPLDSLLFAHLTSLADRLVIDSADFPRPEQTLRELSVRLAADDSTALTDLNWTRLTAWRELLAQFFDVPEWRGFLRAASGLRVGFAVDLDGREVYPSQGLLLFGWMAARLGWRQVERLAPSEAGGLLFRMARPDGAPLWIRLRPRFLRGVEEGAVTGVRILAEAAGRHAEFVLKRAEDGTPHADTEVIVGGSAALRRRVFLPTPDVTKLLAEEFSIIRSDHIYEGALASLCALT